jgi:hypothetical protein
MGVEPDSLSDPFPNDQLFPHWLTDQVTGPIFQNSQGQYYGANPGEVSSDTLNTFLTGTTRENMVDALSPFIKLPIELQTGETLGAGIQTPGQDPVQYVGSQIPGISHIQSLFGIDPIGSLGTLAQGEGLDPTTSVQRGNRDQIDPTKFVNYFLGLGLQNFSTPSAINSAEIELRDKAK